MAMTMTLDPQEFQLLDLVGIWRRRKWLMLTTAAALFCLIAVIAFILPAKYRSTATILIEEPEVPQEMVSSTVGGYADERLQVITQRVMTTQNLVQLIDKYGLYPSERQRLPITQVVDELREAIEFDLISANVKDPRSGRPGKATIAFTLSFDYGEPQMAQQVANELVSLYLAENLRTRREKAAQATGFLASETDKLFREMTDLEAKLAGLKAQYAGVLPEQVPGMYQALDRAQRDLLDLRREKEALLQRQADLNAQLALVSRYSAGGSDPAEQVWLAQAKLASLSAIYGPAHPDVLKARSELGALQGMAGAGTGGPGVQQQLETAKAELAAAQQNFGPNHPDVVRLTAQIAALTAAAEAKSGRSFQASALNPGFVQLQSQIQAIDIQVKALDDETKALNARIANYEQRLAQAPQVETEYLAMRRDYENAVQAYQQMASKKATAEIGETLEVESKGERFALIEPPQSPLRPSEPNRPAILLAGLVFSIAAAGGVGFLRDRADHNIYGVRQLAAIAGMPPLVVVPYIRTAHEQRRGWAVAVSVVVLVIGFVTLSLYFVHNLVKPLDVLWSVAQRRLMSI